MDGDEQQRCTHRVLFIDNYDSFSFNVVQYLSQLGCDVTVMRNDQISVDMCLELKPDFVVISPGR